MPFRTDLSSSDSPLVRGIEVLGDPWVLLVLDSISDGARRFGDIRGRIDIADNILARRLKAMEVHQLIVRVPYKQNGRAKLEYALTTAGTDALDILAAYSSWAETHARPSWTDAGETPSRDNSTIRSGE